MAGKRVGLLPTAIDGEESSAARTGNLNRVRTSPEQSRTDGGPAAGRWRFGAFVLDRATRELRRDGARVHLARRPFDVLEWLVAERPRLVTRAELLQRFWSGRDVYEEALTRCVSSIRKALDDRDDPPRYLETRWNEGYRFIAEVDAEPMPAEAGATEHPAPLPVAGRDPTSSRKRGWLALAALGLLAVAAWIASEVRPAATGAGLERVHRVAVLPLAVSGLDPELGEGIHEELVQAVARIEGLTVIARGSVLSSTAGDSDPVAIGRRLGAEALLAGTVRSAGEHTVIALRLLDARDASVLWTYAARFDPVELTQSREDIATRLATHLSARLRTPVSSGPADPATYALYLRGRHYWNQRTAASLRQAIQSYERAIAAEPDYAEAYAGLAEAWLLMPMYAGTAPSEAHPRARAAAETALRLHPESSRAHMVLGVVYSQFDWDWKTADEHFQKAIELDPNNATAYQWRAEARCYRHDFERCAADLREALALDPLSPILATAQGVPARFAGRTEEARRIFAAALKKHPSFAFAEFQLALIASAEGRWDEAIERYERVLPAMGPVLGGAPLGYAYARAGRTDDARRILADLTRLSANQYVPPIAFSDIAIGLGDRELSLTWLNRALVVHDDYLAQVGVDHHHRDLHDDPRFRAIMARIGTPLPPGEADASK